MRNYGSLAVAMQDLRTGDKPEHPRCWL